MKIQMTHYTEDFFGGEGGKGGDYNVYNTH